MYFEHIVEINDPNEPLAVVLSPEQVWAGLMYRVHEPVVFLPGLDRCVVRQESAGPQPGIRHTRPERTGGRTEPAWDAMRDVGAS